jgi:hypothetical protein
MSGRPPFAKMIVLIASGVALAFFGCLGAITAGSNTPRAVAGGTGFVAGLILLLVGVYHALIWFIDRFAPPSRRSSAAPEPPVRDPSIAADDSEPPQRPGE